MRYLYGEQDGKSDEVPKFVVPLIQDNPTGWGPSSPCEMPDRFKDMPFQSFNKGDRLGKICDFTKAVFKKGKKNANCSLVKSASNKSNSGTAKCHGKDESNFHLVDNTRAQKHPHQRGRYRGNQRNQRGKGGHATVVQGSVKDKEGRAVVQGVGEQLAAEDSYKNSIVNKKWEHRRPQIKNRRTPVPVGSDWIDVKEIDFPKGKLSKDQRWLLSE